LPESSIAACITDPPYNYEFIGRKWNHEELERRINRITDSSTLVKNIPYGSGLAGGVRNKRWYERNRENVIQYQNWCIQWGRELYRVCKSGAYIAVFSSTRTVAHVQVAMEEAGFYTRDCLVFRRHSGIPKGLNMRRKLEKLGDPNAENWEGWHSCLRNEWEAIVLLQKPLTNNYLTTVRDTGVGLMKTINSDGSFQSNILEGYHREAKENSFKHCTVKPVSLMRKLITLLVPPSRDNIILDPFAGSGSTLVASILESMPYLGIEIEKEYVDIALERISNIHNQFKTDLFRQVYNDQQQAVNN